MIPLAVLFQVCQATSSYITIVKHANVLDCLEIMREALIIGHLSTMDLDIINSMDKNNPLMCWGLALNHKGKLFLHFLSPLLGVSYKLLSL